MLRLAVLRLYLLPSITATAPKSSGIDEDPRLTSKAHSLSSIEPTTLSTTKDLRLQDHGQD